MRKESPGGACVSGCLPLVSSSLSLMSVLVGSPSVSLSCALHWGWSKSIWRRATSPITTPCRQLDLVARSTMVNGFTFGGSSPTLFKGVGPRMRSPWALIQGLEYSGSSLPSWLGLFPVNLLYREDFSQSRHGVGVTLVQCEVVNATWRLDGVRIWKLSRTYPGEKPPSLSILTHRSSLSTRKPTRHLLAILCILVRIGAPYEGRWSTPFHLPRNYGTIINPRFLIIFLNRINRMFSSNANMLIRNTHDILKTFVYFQ